MATFGLALGCLAVPLLVVFGRVLLQDRQFAFQDAGHYYYPLLLRVQQEWEAGRWLLWAPEASAGTPPAVGRWLRRVGAVLVAADLGRLGLSWWSARALRARTIAAPGMPPPWEPPRAALVAAAWGVGAALVAWRARGGRDARGF